MPDGSGIRAIENALDAFENAVRDHERAGLDDEHDQGDPATLVRATKRLEGARASLWRAIDPDGPNE